MSRFVGNTFAYWVLIFAVLAFLEPSWFIGLKSAIVPLLGLVMFGMGLTLKLEDFAEVARHPWRVALGVVAHFVIMPGVAWLLCQAFPPAAGNCRRRDPGRLLPKRHIVQRDDVVGPGDLALSVAIAAVTTLLAPLLTPALIWLLASAWLPVSFMELFWSILQVVLLPIVLGVIAQRVLGERVRHAVDVLPLVSVVSIVIIVAAVVAASQAKIAESGLLIMAVVMLHNSFGYLLGYFTWATVQAAVGTTQVAGTGSRHAELWAGRRVGQCAFLATGGSAECTVQRLAQYFRGVAVDVFPTHEREGRPSHPGEHPANLIARSVFGTLRASRGRPRDANER